MEFENTFDRILNSINEYWIEFLELIPGIILAILIVVVGFLISSFISGIFKKTISHKAKDPLIINFLTKVIKLSLIILAVLFGLRIAGLQGIATGLLTAAGASAVIIGFAFKDIGENFISGIILSFNRPFNLNDTIMIGEVFGKVKAIEFRYTKLKTFDGRDVYIPNSDIIRKVLYNYTEDGFYRLDFLVGIDYEDDIELAKKVIIAAVVDTPGVINTDEHDSFITVDSLGVSTVNLKVIFWTKTKEYKRTALEIKSDVVKNVKKVVMANGLNMPADITEIKLYGSQDSIPITLKENVDETYKNNEQKK